MYPEKRLELVHFQITRNCNLRCWFCGQWGKKGFFSDKSGDEMTFAEWKKVIDEIKLRCAKLPSVILWGGEPLMSCCFDELSEHLFEMGFDVAIVTNGTLIHKHKKYISKYIKRIYVSIDGPEEIHDSIRGIGTYKRVKENLQLIRGSDTEIIIMSVLTPALLACLEKLPTDFASLKPDKVVLQEMINFSDSEAENYSKWLMDEFNIKESDINSWVTECNSYNYNEKMDKIRKLLKKKLPFIVEYRPHGIETGREFCLSPFRHAHIAWNGNVLYCTDFYDFSAGNVKNKPLFEIFENEISEKYRSEIMLGRCSACNHCSWRNNTFFGI